MAKGVCGLLSVAGLVCGLLNRLFWLEVVRDNPEDSVCPVSHPLGVSVVQSLVADAVGINWVCLLLPCLTFAW